MSVVTFNPIFIVTWESYCQRLHFNSVEEKLEIVGKGRLLNTRATRYTLLEHVEEPAGGIVARC